MLSHFISKSSHLRLVALVSSKTCFLNPKPISPVPSISIPNPYYNNSHFFFSPGNNNNGKDFWKLSSEDEQSVFEEDSTSVEEIERQVLDGDGSWAKRDEEINDVFKQEKGVSVEEENWVTAQGYKPWSFDTEDASGRVFDDVKVDQTEMHGFDQAEDKVKDNPEEKKLLDMEERALTEVLKGSCTGELTIGRSKLSKPSESVYSKDVSEIIEIIEGDREGLRHRLSSVASKISFKFIIQIFEILNEQRISGLKFFNWLRDSYPEFYRSAHVNSLIICNCGWLNDHKTMLSLLVEFKAEEICLTDKAFGFLIVCGSSNNSLINSTRKVVAMLNDVGGSCRGSGVYGLIEMFCCLDLFEMATFVIEITERIASHYNILIRKRCKAGHIEEARAIIKGMCEVGCSPNTESYNYLLGTLCKNNEMDDVPNVLEEMRTKGLNPDAITCEALVYHSSSRGQVDVASKFLNLMVNESVEPRSSTHAAFLKVLLEAGERGKAYKYVIDMSTKYNHCGNTLYSLLARLHQKKGDLMTAQSILNEMIDKGLKPDFGTFIEIVKKLQKTGRKSLARDLRTKYSAFYCCDMQKPTNSLCNSFVPCQG